MGALTTLQMVPDKVGLTWRSGEMMRLEGLSKAEIILLEDLSGRVPRSGSGGSKAGSGTWIPLSTGMSKFPTYLAEVRLCLFYFCFCPCQLLVGTQIVTVILRMGVCMDVQVFVTVC